MHRGWLAALCMICCVLSIEQAPGADGASQRSITQALRSGDLQRAFDLAVRGAQEGDSWAMDALGLMYLSGQSPVGRDYAAAKEWLTKAAAAGNGNAMNRLGEMYFNGWGVPKDEAEAVVWYRRGVDQGSHAAMNNLALCLLNGVSVSNNVEEGLALLREAAEQDATAKGELG